MQGSLMAMMANISSAIYLNPVEAINLQHWSLAAELQAGIGIGVTKVSICWFILRILKQTRRNVRILIWIDIAFVVATTAAYAFSQGLACIPLESYWNPTIHGKCLTKNSLNVVALVNNSAYMSATIVRSAN